MIPDVNIIIIPKFVNALSLKEPGKIDSPIAIIIIYKNPNQSPKIANFANFIFITSIKK
jgi:hypothetical protein